MFLIKSENLGLSTSFYKTYNEALESARKAWKLDPARVGMCTIEDYNPMSAYNLGYCECENRACECNLPAYL